MFQVSPLVSLVFCRVGTRDAFDFGDYIFEQFLKHGESYVIKFPIGSPSQICGILIHQNNDIVTCDVEIGVASSV